MHNLDSYLERQATALDCLPDECPDPECEGHLVFNESAETYDCTHCRYREDLDMRQVGGKEPI